MGIKQPDVLSEGTVLSPTDKSTTQSAGNTSTPSGYKHLLSLSLFSLIVMAALFLSSLNPLHLLEWAVSFSTFEWLRKHLPASLKNRFLLKTAGLGLFTGLAPVWVLTLLNIQQLFIVPLLLVALSASALILLSDRKSAIAYTLGCISPFAAFTLTIHQSLAPIWFIGWLVALGTLLSAYRFHSKSLSLRRTSKDSTLISSSTEELSLAKDLASAIDNNALEIYFQPRFSLITNSVDKVEALVRWNHPDKGYIEPTLVISIAEKTGLINQLGKWVITQSCSQASQWQHQGIAVQVSVNLSAGQLLDNNLHTLISDALNKSQLAPENLELELTESLLIEQFEHAVHSLESIKALGVSVSLDDFGTGYSSLSYLKQLPLDTLKIDRSLIFDLPENERGRAVAESIITMAHRLNLKVVAEGIENSDTIELLRQFQCDEIQGNYICQALPATQLTRKLSDGFTI